jgi:hypothetical protein
MFIIAAEFAEDALKSFGPHLTSVEATNTGLDQNNAVALTLEIRTEAARHDKGSLNPYS